MHKAYAKLKNRPLVRDRSVFGIKFLVFIYLFLFFIAIIH